MGSVSYREVHPGYDDEGIWTPHTRYGFDADCAKTPARTSRPAVFELHLDRPFEDSELDVLLALMAVNARHRFLVIGDDVELRALGRCVDRKRSDFGRLGFVASDLGLPGAGFVTEWPPPNVWVGTTVSSQADADRRVPVLLDVACVRRFVIVDHQTEHVDLDPPRCQYGCSPEEIWPVKLGSVPWCNGCDSEAVQGWWLTWDLDVPGINWVVCSPARRGFETDDGWAHSLSMQCDPDVAFFYECAGSNELDGRVWTQVPGMVTGG